MTTATQSASYSLTPLQEGMLFHSRLAPDAGVYVQQVVVHLPELIDVDAMKQAWQFVVQRHAVLRTAFTNEADETRQVIAEELDVPFEEIEGTGQSLEHWLVADRRRGFDLGQSPLMRLTMLRRGDADNQLIWTFHHALLDGRSHRQVLEEAFTAYEAFREGAYPSLLPTRPFAHHIDWLAQQDQAAAEQHWRGVLADFEAPTPLPASHAAIQNSAPAPGEFSVSLSDQVSAELRALTAEHDVSVTTLVQTAWSILLVRYSGVSDVIFGGARAGRRPELERNGSTVGLLINTLPVRARVNPDAPLLELLHDLRRQWLAGRDVDFAAPIDVQSWAGLPGGTPLYETIVVAESYDLNESLRSRGGVWKDRSVELHEFPHYPLALTASLGAELRLRLLFDRQRIDDSAAQRLLGHLRTLLEAMPTHVERPTRELPMLTAGEQQQVLVEWNDTAADYPRDRRLEQLVEDQVDRTPNAAAVVHEGQTWSYRELDERANCLAHHLIGLGAGPGTLVGVCMNRSAEMVAAVLGILKTGAAYVPLDPAYPKERLAFLFGDTGAVALVTQVRRLGQLPEMHVPVVCIDADWPTIALHPATRSIEAAPRDSRGAKCAEGLAYVIYTSGSTGAPKGVALRHRAVVNTIDWVNKTLRVGPGDRVLWVTSLCFDLSVYDLFGVLAAGGTVRVATGSELRDPERLLDVLVREPITIWDSAPSLLAQLAPHFDKVRDHAATSNLRLVMLSGDWIPVSLPDQVRDTFPGARVVSLGGATEAAIWSNWHPIEKVDPAWTSIPYGRPIQNARYYLLDCHGQPAPVGVPAELYIAGDCLADGYYHRPDLTSERFIPEIADCGLRIADLNPKSGIRNPKSRMYRTGDLAKYWPDGTIEFLGRRDQQVKIRGFRIELGEIEATLAKHADVDRAVVTVVNNAAGERQLAAYVVPLPEAAPAVTHGGLNANLRKYLQERLPDYLTPTHIICLDALPLTANGKVDRKRLPAPEHTAPVAGSVPPRNADESTLAEIWCDILGLDRVGVHDNFFELGGHSLKAAQVVSRVRLNLDRELPLATFFRTPTIAAAVRALEKPQANGRSTPQDRLGVSRVQAGATQRQIWFLHQLGQSSDVYSIGYALVLQGETNADALRRALDGLVARHAALRTTFNDDGGQLWQVIGPAYSVELPFTDLSKMPRAQRELAANELAAEHTRAPFEFRRGPLFRARLVKLGEDEHQLLLAWHHLILDGQSLSVLLRDLCALYSAALTGQDAQLPPPLSFAEDCRRLDADFAGRQSEMLEHWTKALTPLPPPIDLPGSKSRPATPTFRGDEAMLDLPDNTAESIAALARRESATPFVVLLAAFQALIHRLTGLDDFAVGAPVACRARPRTEDVVGPLVNTLLLRADLSGEPTFADLLARTRRTVHEALAHQELPFDVLISELRPRRDGAQQGLVQVLFNYSPGLSEFTPPSARWTAVPVATGTSKFDLSLIVDDGPGGLLGRIEFSRELFDDATIERFAGHFRTLLTAALADPATRVSRLPLLSESERRDIFENWQGKTVDSAKGPAHRIIAARAAVHPDHVAIRHAGQDITFGVLDRRADQLARHLQTLGVGRDVPVAIALERSAEWIVAALAIWKAGGAYVPLDIRHPAERLAFFLRDARPPVMVTRSDVARRLPPHDAKVVCLDTNAIGESPPATRRGPNEENDLAYIVYTSGSTGTPKGVMVRHGGLSNLLGWLAKAFGRGPEDRFLAIGTPAFDIHVLEVWHALSIGATVEIGPADAAADGRVLARTLRQSRPTVLQATPATWRLLLAAGWEGDPNLTAMSGGEALPTDLAAALLPRVRTLWNLYGPTEITVAATGHRVESAEGPIPIGRPIDNTRAYVLDARGLPTPVGVVGELFIAGAGVGSGYLGRPDLTAERFLLEISDCGLRIGDLSINPKSAIRNPQSLMYRTGDLASWRADGVLAYHGRCDQQVKIRGHRIELGEVELALARHPAVAQAAASTRRGNDGLDELVAYVVLKSPLVVRGGLNEELRRFLRTTLPEYMTPSAIIAIDRLPLTPGGKIDRRALPAIEATPIARTIVPPRNDIERDLAPIWGGVLNISPVSMTEDFFDLGGHSYQAGVLMTRIQERLGHSLPLGTLFAAPTIEKLAAVLQRKLETGTAGNLVPLREEGTKPPLFLIAGIGGHVFTFHKFARLLGADQPAYGVKAIGVDGSARTPDRIEDIAARYAEEIAAVRPDGPIVLGGFSIGAQVAFELALQLQAQGREIGPLIVFDATAPGYPRPKPLFRRALVHMKTLTTGHGVNRWEYLQERFGKVKARLLRLVGKDAQVIERVEGLDALPQETLQQVRAALQTAVSRYQPTRKFEGRVLLFQASEREAWTAAVYDDPEMGWGQLATGDVEIHWVPGKHLELFRETNLPMMAQTLRERLKS